MRQCPTLPGDERPLIAHSIVIGVCMERQREFYHKCHRCIFRGKPVDFVHEPVHEKAANPAPADAVPAAIEPAS